MDFKEESVHQGRPADINRGGEIILLLDGTISRSNQSVWFLLACCLQVKPDVEESSLVEGHNDGWSLQTFRSCCLPSFSLMRTNSKNTTQAGFFVWIPKHTFCFYTLLAQMSHDAFN